MRIGVISDTHGLLRPEAVQALEGTQLILHAGDVGSPEVLTKLKAIAPVLAVRGNVDTEPWAMELPATVVLEAGGASFFMLHNLQELDVKQEAAKPDFVISGHTHQADQHDRNGVTYLNPGSAGPRRFHLPVTLAVLDLTKKPWNAEVIRLLE